MLINQRLIEDVLVPSETASIIEDISVRSDTPILNEGHASYEGTGEIVNVIVKVWYTSNIDAHVHDTNDVAPELVGLVSLIRYLGIHLPHL